MNRPFWSFRTSASLDNCETIEPLLSLAADGMASPEETRRIDTHLPGCEGCRAALTWMQATRTALSSRPVALPPPDLHSRIALAIALSSRPVAVLPPDLHSRIALAIAASAAAPVSLRPARVFTLRTAYAAAASLTALGIALSYPLWQTPGQVSGNHPAKSTTVAVVPATKTPLAPKIAKRPLVASVPAKPITIKHPVVAHETAPIVAAPLAHTASNDVPAKPSVVPPAVKAPMHYAVLSPRIASHDIAPTENHSTEKHAPVPTVNTTVSKLPEGTRIAKIIKEPLRLELPAPKIIPDVPVVQTASAHTTSDNPLGPVLVYVNHASHASFTAISVPANQHAQEAAYIARAAIGGDHIAVLGDIHSP